MPADRLPAALGDLDPGNRALLDLSLRRGVSDAEIGELLRKEPDDVARGRDAVLELIADALDVGGQDRRERVRRAIAALPDDAWRAGAESAEPAPAPEPARTPDPEPAPEPEQRETSNDQRGAPAATAPPRPSIRLPREPDEHDGPARLPLGAADEDFDEPERSSRRGGLLVFVALLGVAAVLAIVLIGGDDEEDPAGSADNGGDPAPPPGGNQGAGREARLAAVGGGRGSGRLIVTDAGATIVLRGLPDPDGAYEVWLYENIVRARSLGTIADGGGRLEVKLPADAGSYPFLDVSREPSDGNPNHSGQSVIRAPLETVLGD
ncbi:MAG TPA: anti-sigma factor [Thermoleophilaceae bacterium]|nr:anti-sigma factor [Thermoleophilaceae bacterium]